MPTEVRTERRPRRVESYVKAELALRRLDDQLRAKSDAQRPLLLRVQRANDRAWRTWQAMNHEEKDIAISVVGGGRVTAVPPGAGR